MAVAGWYADPYGAQGQLRYWDGTQWTANVMPRPSSAPLQGAAGSGAANAQAAQMQARMMHESIPLGANATAAPAGGSYAYQGQASQTDQQYGAQTAQTAQAAQAAQSAQAAQAAQANPYGATQNQGYAQMANAYEAAAQGYAQAANAYDAAAQGYAQVGGQYDPSQGYGQYDPNAQAYGQAASPYYQGYDPYQQMGQGAYQVPEGSNRTLRLLAFIFSIISIVAVLALLALVAINFFQVANGNSAAYAFGAFLGSSALSFLVAVPLAWMIPMCVHTRGILKGTKRNTVLFGVFMLLLCGVLPGVFLLFAKKDPKPLY